MNEHHIYSKFINLRCFIDVLYLFEGEKSWSILNLFSALDVSRWIFYYVQGSSSWTTKCSSQIRAFSSQHSNQLATFHSQLRNCNIIILCVIYVWLPGKLNSFEYAK